MHGAVLRCLRQSFLNRHRPSALCLSSMACCLKSPDDQEPIRSPICNEYRSQCIHPAITLAVRTSNWDVARKISFRECVGLYGLSQSIGLFALIMQSFLPRRIREIRCLIQSIVDHCGNAGPELFELAPMLVSNLRGSMTLLQVYVAIIRIFVELSMFEDALLTYIEAKKIGVELQVCNFLLKRFVERNQIMYARSLFDDMKSSSTSPNVYSCSVLMSMYTHGAKLRVEEALELFYEMDERCEAECCNLWYLSLWALPCQTSDICMGLQILLQRGYSCNSYCFNAVIHGFFHEGQV